MKTLGLVLLVIGLVASESNDKANWSEKLQQYRQECVKESGVQDELVTKADLGEFPDTRELKCFAKCFYRKLGYISDEGELLWDVVKKNMPDNEYQAQSLAILEMCKDSKGTDACETAYAIHKCYYLNAQQVIELEKQQNKEETEGKPQN